MAWRFLKIQLNFLPEVIVEDTGEEEMVVLPGDDQARAASPALKRAPLLPPTFLGRKFSYTANRKRNNIPSEFSLKEFLTS